MTIGELIKAERKKRGLSQVALAGLMGRSEFWIVALETGRRPNSPTFKDVQLLCKVLKVSIEITSDGALTIAPWRVWTSGPVTNTEYIP